MKSTETETVSVALDTHGEDVLEKLELRFFFMKNLIFEQFGELICRTFELNDFLNETETDLIGLLQDILPGLKP